MFAALVTAGLYSLAHPPFGAEILLFGALVPLLAVAERVGPARAALAGAGFGLLIAAFIVAWIGPTLVGYYERSIPFTAALLLLLWLTMGAPFYAVALGALAFVRPHVSRGAWLLLVPVAWVTAEITRSQLGLRASWALVGDAFHSFERLRQIADVTAVYGVSFVVVLANAVLLQGVRALRDRGARPGFARIALVFLVLLSGVLLYGERARDRFPTGASDEGLDVLLVQGNVETRLRWQRTLATRVLMRYGSLTREATAGDTPPDLVIWPENAIQTGVEDAVHGPPLRRFADGLGVPLLLGAPRNEQRDGETVHFNAVHLLAPGAAPDFYDKRRLMPFGESDPIGDAFDTGRRGDLDSGRWLAGERLGVFGIGDQLFGILICLEAIYPEMARDVVASGARVLVNLSNDGWFQGAGGPEQHFQQTVFRAIETRRPLLRVTTTGITALVEPDGTVARRLDHGERGTLRVRVRPASGDPSFYVRFGDVFGWGCVAVLAGAVAIAAVRRARGDPHALAPEPR